jgi:hypothetical protein
MHSLGQVCIGVAGQRRRPKKAVVRRATACRSSRTPRASAWLHANAAPRRPPKAHCRHQVLPGRGVAKDLSRQTRACGKRTSHRLAHSRGAFRILRPGNIRRRAWLELGIATLSACMKPLRNRRYVEIGRRRCKRSSRIAGGGPDGSQSAALLSVWRIRHFKGLLAAGVDGSARWDSDRSRR